MSELKQKSTQILFKATMVGGAIGLIGGWFGIDPKRSLFLGFFFGVLAGVTKIFLDKRNK